MRWGREEKTEVLGSRWEASVKFSVLLKNLKTKTKTLYVYVFCQHVDLCTTWTVQARPEEDDIIGLQVVLSSHMGAGNRTQVLWKTSQCS